MLNQIWGLMLLCGILTAAFTGQVETVSNSVLSSAEDAVDLLVFMCGVVGMWNGFLFIADDSGLTKKLALKMKPLMRILFPTLPASHPATDYICSNFIANLLGLGWACTPTGIAAMKALRDRDVKCGRSGTVAGNEMCTFLVLNISSLQLIPMNMIAYRSNYGSATPSAVVAPALLSTLCTTVVAALLCKLLSRRSRP